MTAYTTWRRKLAVSESMALRALVRTHGRLPAFQPTVARYDDYLRACNAERGRQYRAAKKEAA